jgi:Holliday junction resolvase RusA-like endonuclease
MRYRRTDTPAYLVWVEQRPSNKGKGKKAYVEAVRAAAAAEVARPIKAADVEVEVVYSTKTAAAARMDVDNINKCTLDALKGVAYDDDAQVRSVTSTIFDRRKSHTVAGLVEHMGRLFYSASPDVVLITVYSDSRLEELGGEAEVQRRRYEAWQREFDAAVGLLRSGEPA